MRGSWWCLAGALVGVAACTGVPFTEAAPGNDSGEREGGAGVLLPDGGGGAMMIDSSATPQGYGSAYAEASPPADAGTEDAWHSHNDGGWIPAVPPGMPAVVTSGGPVLTAPVVQSFSFANYDLTPWVDDFVSKVGGTSYWQKAVSEYGVGPATAANPVHLPYGGPSNIQDSQIQDWLAGEIQNDPAVMPPSPNTLYIIFYPATSNIMFQGLQSCFTFGAYHNGFLLDGVGITYAVIPECARSSISTLQATTEAASHELVEAATDPLPLSDTTAYGSIDPDHLYMQVVLGGGETGDLCAAWPSSFFMPAGFGYTVQRTWSNAAAAAGHDPCQPALPNEPFFNAVPLESGDDVQITDQFHSYPTKGTRIAMGETRTIDVRLYSDDDVGSWAVEAKNVPATASNLEFTWDRTTGQNGDTLHLTIHVAGVDGNYAGEPYLITSTWGSSKTYWIGYVSQ